MSGCVRVQPAGTEWDKPWLARNRSIAVTASEFLCLSLSILAAPADESSEIPKVLAQFKKPDLVIVVIIEIA